MLALLHASNAGDGRLRLNPSSTGSSSTDMMSARGLVDMLLCGCGCGCGGWVSGVGNQVLGLGLGLGTGLGTGTGPQRQSRVAANLGNDRRAEGCVIEGLSRVGEKRRQQTAARGGRKESRVGRGRGRR